MGGTIFLLVCIILGNIFMWNAELELYSGYLIYTILIFAIYLVATLNL